MFRTKNSKEYVTILKKKNEGTYCACRWATSSTWTNTTSTAKRFTSEEFSQLDKFHHLECSKLFLNLAQEVLRDQVPPELRAILRGCLQEPQGKEQEKMSDQRSMAFWVRVCVFRESHHDRLHSVLCYIQYFKFYSFSLSSHAVTWLPLFLFHASWNVHDKNTKVVYSQKCTLYFSKIKFK